MDDAYTDLPRSLTGYRPTCQWILLPVMALSCLASCGPTPMPPAAGASIDRRPGETLLRELPPQFVELTALRALDRILSTAQLEVVEYFLENETLGRDEQEALAAQRTFLQFLHEEIREPAPTPVTRRLEGLGISLVDPRPVDLRLATLNKRIENEVCPRLVLVDDQNFDGEMHNLFVFYARNVLGSCGGPVRWQPDPANDRIAEIHALFAADQYFKHLDAYLEDFRNEPFMRRRNIYVAIYFQYLDLAFRARVVDFPRREFLDRRIELRERFPEIIYVSEYFAVMVRAGLVR